MKLKFLIICLLLIGCMNVFSQETEKTKKLIQEALKLIEDSKDYKQANTLFEKALNLDSYMTPEHKTAYGVSLYKEKEFEKSNEILVTIPSGQLNEEAMLYLGLLNNIYQKYEQSAEYFQRVKDGLGPRAKIARSLHSAALWCISNNKVGGSKLKKMKMPRGMSYDGLSFIEENTVVVSHKDREEGYMNMYTTDVEYINLKNLTLMSTKFKSPYEMGSPSMTQSEPKMLYFTMYRNNKDKCTDLQMCQRIYYSKLEDGIWQRPIPFRFNYRDEDNIFAIGNPAISASNQVLFFCSNIKGGLGFGDIYYSIRSENGDWDMPVNIKGVNTPFEETTPYYDEEANRLYFSSNGHLGYGNLDVFYVDLDDNYQPKGKPVNLKRPVNSPFDDYYYIVSPNDPDVGYMASKRNDRINNELFRVAIGETPATVEVEIEEDSEEIQPTKVTLHSARDNVLLPESLEDISTAYPVAMIDRVLYDYDRFDTIDLSILESDLLSSADITEDTPIVEPVITEKEEVKVIQPPKKDPVPGKTIEQKKTPKKKAKKLVKKRIPKKRHKKKYLFTKKGRKGKKKSSKPKITPENLLARLFFKSKSTKPNRKVHQALSKIANYLKTHKFKKLNILGYTDTYGETKENKYLAWQRAIKIRDILVNTYDIELNKIHVFGVGEKDYLNGLLSSLIPDKAHAGHRKVELFIE